MRAAPLQRALGLPCARRPLVDFQVIWDPARTLALKVVGMGGRSYVEVWGFCMIRERFYTQSAFFRGFLNAE